MAASQTTVVRKSSDGTEVTLLPPKPTSTRPQPRAKKWFTTTAPATYDKVLLVAALLGGLVGAGLTILPSTPSMGTYLLATGVFHLLEFWVTARFNSGKLGMASFLLTNGVEYVIAQSFSVAEFMLRWRFTGHTPRFPSVPFNIGLIAVICGQMLRTGAMIQAAQSFSHFLQNEHLEDHVLVQNGLYGTMRHPSYTGFYLWAVGMQLVLDNWISAVLYSVVLLHFFTLRIREEEKSLERFFGESYVQYRGRVWSGIPLVR